MGKKRAPRRPPDPGRHEASDAAGPPRAEQGVDRSPEVTSACDAVRRAEAELKKAQDYYRKVRREATERLKAVREKTLGDVIDGAFQMVRKYPGPGVIIAAVIGFFLGRLFRR